MRIGLGVVLLLCWTSVLSVWAEPEEIHDKGCRDCHRFSSLEQKSKEGPDLFYAGDKFHRNWLKGFLQLPVVIRKAVSVLDSDYHDGKAQTNQPHVVLTKDESEKISDFLMTLHLPGLEMGKIDEELLSKGEQVRGKILFERNFGCISCHQTLNLAGKARGGVSGPSLVNSGLRLKSDWIFHWLKTPRKFLSKGRMPLYDLDEKTAILITKYILSIRTKPSGIRHRPQ